MVPETVTVCVPDATPAHVVNVVSEPLTVISGPVTVCVNGTATETQPVGLFFTVILNPYVFAKLAGIVT